jgi:hypothetical protein
MATQKKNKKNANRLDFNTINKASEKQFVTKTITIQVDGKDYEVTIDQSFKTTKAEKLIDSLTKPEKLQRLQQINECSDSIKVSYYFYLIIREYTDLDIPNDLTFEQELVLIDGLINLGIYETILSEIPDGEIKKITDLIHKFSVNLQEVTKEMNVENLALENELSGQDG